ncbi:MAG TPA: alpha/beta hydrolase [Steroidobacteraceae bacterium]|nr:alpha/beta hydrolase [Steroidobacteraceae bacterium]
MQTLDQYFTSGASRLRYRDQGQGSVLILIHGWTLDLEMWQPQALELSRSYRVISYDRRGFGLSSGLPSLAEDCVDLEALTDHLQIGSAVVVGMSQGARVALDFALRLPQRVAALILDGPPNPADAMDGSVDEEVPRTRYRELIRTQGLEAFRKEWQRHPFARLHTAEPQTRELLEQMLASYPARDLREPPTQSAPGITADALESLRRPVLVLNGEFDTDTRKHIGVVLSHALPFATRELVPRAGHLANLDNPHVYNDLIRQFLARLARAAA